MVAQTFRTGKIIDYVQRLMWRRESYAKELEDTLFPQEIKQNIYGQIQALDMVIRELIKEFDIKEDDFKERTSV